MIEPDIWTDSGFIELSWGARLLFIGMISRADDEGRGNAASKSLKAAIFPGDDTSLSKIDGFKAEIEKYTRSKFYEVNGQSYYQLDKWLAHQQIQYPKPSAIPPFNEHSMNDTGTFNEHSPQLINELNNQLINKSAINERSVAASAPCDMGAVPAEETKKKIKKMFSKIITEGDAT